MKLNSESLTASSIMVRLSKTRHEGPARLVPPACNEKQRLKSRFVSAWPTNVLWKTLVPPLGPARKLLVFADLSPIQVRKAGML